MLRHHLPPLLALTFVTVAAHAAGSRVRAADIPRAFDGEYRWHDESEPNGVTLTLDAIADDDGRIRFSGHDAYARFGCRMKVDGFIDPRTRHLSMRESAPSARECVTDGSFEGTLSADRLHIDAVWTTASTGQQGTLALRAEGKPDAR